MMPTTTVVVFNRPALHATQCDDSRPSRRRTNWLCHANLGPSSPPSTNTRCLPTPTFSASATTRALAARMSAAADGISTARSFLSPSRIRPCTFLERFPVVRPSSCRYLSCCIRSQRRCKKSGGDCRSYRLVLNTDLSEGIQSPGGRRCYSTSARLSAAGGCATRTPSAEPKLLTRRTSRRTIASKKSRTRSTPRGSPCGLWIVTTRRRGPRWC
mmetsp:Transcript_31847/g.98536  ORF Transcript_31847/g.98536 Transcript_31847/m.98536 type:complete len:214 (+) Transcript_31847:281-922(+)